MPGTRALTADETQELEDLAEQGQSLLAEVVPASAPLAQRLEALRHLVERVRAGELPAAPFDEADELAYTLGSLWGRWVVEKSGWAWTWLTLDDGFEGYALVPEGEAYAVWPHHFLYGLLEIEEAENTAVVLAECIFSGELPPAEPGDLVLLG